MVSIVSIESTGSDPKVDSVVDSTTSLAHSIETMTRQVKTITTRKRYGLALRTSQYKYIRWNNGKEELYDLTSDPTESKDLTPNRKAGPFRRDIQSWQKAMAMLRESIEAGQEAAVMDEETQDILRDLGYVGEDPE